VQECIGFSTYKGGSCPHRRSRLFFNSWHAKAFAAIAANPSAFASITQQSAALATVAANPQAFAAIAAQPGLSALVSNPGFAAALNQAGVSQSHSE